MLRVRLSHVLCSREILSPKICTKITGVFWFSCLSSANTNPPKSKKPWPFALPIFVQRRSTSKEPGYKDFGHGRRKLAMTDFVLFIWMGGLSLYLLYLCFDTWPDRYKKLFTGKAANKPLGRNQADSKEGSSMDNGGDEKGDGQIKEKKPKVTFRDKKHGPSFEVFMTPDDFVRSMTPGVKQPEGLGLEQFTTFDPQTGFLQSNLADDSVFYKLGKHGLISYTDYIFLLTLLSTSARHFALAFKMFDINGDGELDYNEFEMVESVIRNQTKVGAKHRDHSSTGTILRRHTNSSLAAYFFGPNLDQKLTIDRFLDFQTNLQRDILKLEFDRCEPKNDRISEVNFCKMLLQHANLPEKSQQQMIKRVKKLYGQIRAKHIGLAHSIPPPGYRSETTANTPQVPIGFTFREVENFFCFLNNISDVDTALTFYRVAGAPIDARTLQHVARAVTGFDIPDHVIECVFALFDENQDGELSNKEFISVMKRRLMRGLERPKDTGFVRILAAIWRCGCDLVPATHRQTEG